MGLVEQIQTRHKFPIGHRVPSWQEHIVTSCFEARLGR